MFVPEVTVKPVYLLRSETDKSLAFLITYNTNPTGKLSCDFSDSKYTGSDRDDRGSIPAATSSLLASLWREVKISNE